MGYIHEIRQMIGHYPLIGIGATIIVTDATGKLLLQLRTDTNTWGIPGGAMEPGETIEEAAHRELYEETGLTTEKLHLLGVLSGPEFFFTYPNGDQTHPVIVLFQAAGVYGDLSINDGESHQLAYFPLDELPEMESRAAAVLRIYMKSML